MTTREKPPAIVPTTEPAACIPASTSEPPRKHRAHSVGPQEIFLLDQWGRQLYEAFHAMPYLVGSVARGERYWRDVDVRMPLEDDAWPFDEERPSRLFALNLAISLWVARYGRGDPSCFAHLFTFSRAADSRSPRAHAPRAASAPPR